MRREPDFVFLRSTLAVHGLIGHGSLNFASGDPPIFEIDRHAKLLVLIGHAGSSIWPHFTGWLCANYASLLYDFRAHGASSSSDFRQLLDPLDSWSKEVIGDIAKTFGGRAIYPSDQPYHPFQQWAMAATGMKPSPLGILIHPVYGLWHAYRAAIIFDQLKHSQKSDVLNQSDEKLSHPCDSCAEKPCLSACPVDAFSDGEYDVKSCRAHVKSDGGLACRTKGCLARRVCPVGKEFEYVPEQMEFHMNAFVK